MITRLACMDIQSSTKGNAGASAAVRNSEATRNIFCRRKPAWRDAIAARFRSASRTLAVPLCGTPGRGPRTQSRRLSLMLSPRSYHAARLHAEKTLRANCQQRDDQHEGRSGLKLRAEIAAGQILGDADH